MKKRVYKSRVYKPYLIFIRYLILLIITIFSLPLLYKIFTPLTIYPSAYLLKLFYNIAINNDIIIINSETFIKLIPACIAGSAYLLLLILNLAIPMSIKKRIYSIFFSFLILLILNISRIFLLSILYHNNTPFIDFTHKLFWYVVSTVFVVFIWFLTIKIFSIKEIPIYTDINYLLKINKIS